MYAASKPKSRPLPANVPQIAACAQSGSVVIENVCWCAVASVR
jgi:hypothetical protein